MADINSVIVKITDALSEAQTVAGVPTDADTIASLQTQIATATAALTAAQDSLAALTTSDNALKAKLATIVGDINTASQDIAKAAQDAA